jgi:hypothetical protein
MAESCKQRADKTARRLENKLNGDIPNSYIQFWEELAAPTLLEILQSQAIG